MPFCLLQDVLVICKWSSLWKGGNKEAEAQVRELAGNWKRNVVRRNKDSNSDSQLKKEKTEKRL